MHNQKIIDIFEEELRNTGTQELSKICKILPFILFRFKSSQNYFPQITNPHQNKGQMYDFFIYHIICVQKRVEHSTILKLNNPKKSPVPLCSRPPCTCDWQARHIPRTNQRGDTLIGQKWAGNGVKSKWTRTEHSRSDLEIDFLTDIAFHPLITVTLQ